MFQCMRKNLDVSVILATIIVLLTVVSSFGITEYANYLQVGVLNLDTIPWSYRVYFKLSSVYVIFLPIAMFLYLFITIKLMMNYFFEDYLSSKTLYIMIGIGFVPVLLYQYFFWFNLVSYCNLHVIKTTDDFMNMRFMFGLDLKALGFISNIGWGALYLIITLWMYLTGRSLIKTLCSVVVPTLFVILMYHIIK